MSTEYAIFPQNGKIIQVANQTRLFIMLDLLLELKVWEKNGYIWQNYKRNYNYFLYQKLPIVIGV